MILVSGCVQLVYSCKCCPFDSSNGEYRKCSGTSDHPLARIPGAAGGFQGPGLEWKFQGRAVGVPYLFLGGHDAHLRDIVGGGWYRIWEAPVLSPFFCQDVVQVWDPARDDGRILPCDEEDVPEMVEPSSIALVRSYEGAVHVLSRCQEV